MGKIYKFLLIIYLKVTTRPEKMEKSLNVNSVNGSIDTLPYFSEKLMNFQPD